MWRWVLFAYLVAVAVVGTLFEIFAMPEQAQYQALVSHGVRTTGQVVPDNSLRGGLGYSFVVQRQTYRMSGSFDYLSNQKVGDSVPVVYEASNPTNNCSCDPAQDLSGLRWSPLLLAAWISLLVPGAYVMYRRMQATSANTFGRFRMRVGPPSRFVWWGVIAIALSIGLEIASLVLPKAIYLFVVIPVLALIWFPTGVLLDRWLTPRLRPAQRTD
jgi:hypothetical protein